MFENETKNCGNQTVGIESMRKTIRRIVFIVGFLICSFPFFSNLAKWSYQKDVIATYSKQVDTFDSQTQETLSLAREYNDILYQSHGKYISNWNESILSDESYENMLNITGNGMMGRIEIPKINVNLPIYHGTSADVLSIGVGHLQGTSLPVGGENTRTVLTGHRGSPSSKLFTRLDEMEVNDLIFVHILDETLAYQVIEIEVIRPEEAEKLEIIEGKDQLTLLTCTPYGINSHRLIITGERVSYTEKMDKTIESQGMSLRETIFTVVPFLLLAVGGILIVMEMINKKRERQVK